MGGGREGVWMVTIGRTVEVMLLLVVMVVLVAVAAVEVYFEVTNN